MWGPPHPASSLRQAALCTGSRIPRQRVQVHPAASYAAAYAIGELEAQKDATRGEVPALAPGPHRQSQPGRLCAHCTALHYSARNESPSSCTRRPRMQSSRASPRRRPRPAPGATTQPRLLARLAPPVVDRRGVWYRVSRVRSAKNSVIVSRKLWQQQQEQLRVPSWPRQPSDWTRRGLRGQRLARHGTRRVTATVADARQAEWCPVAQ